MSSLYGTRTGQLGNATGGFTGDVVPKGFNMGQLQQFTPAQMQLFQQMFSQVSPNSQLSRLAGGDQSAFAASEAPAWRDFNAMQGNMASRFSFGGGPGSLSSRGSSGFQNAMTASGSNFAQDLQSQRQQLQRQALMDLMGISGSLLGQRPYERSFVENPQKQNSFMQQMLLGLTGGIGQGFGQMAGAFI